MPRSCDEAILFFSYKFQYTRPFFSYFNQNGKASKPFVLTQKEPEFYDSFLKNYNIPELITGSDDPSAFDIREVILAEAQPANLNPSVDKSYLEEDLGKKNMNQNMPTKEEH